MHQSDQAAPARRRPGPNRYLRRGLSDFRAAWLGHRGAMAHQRPVDKHRRGQIQEQANGLLTSVGRCSSTIDVPARAPTRTAAGIGRPDVR